MYHKLPDPDCIVAFSFTAPGQTSPLAPQNGFDNRENGCNVWSLTYSVSGFASVNISLQSAPNNAGIPGTWVTFAGQTVFAGSNPNTNLVTNTLAQVSGYQPWVRVSLNSAGGSGVVTGSLYGWKIPSAEPGQGGGGGGGNVTITEPIGQTDMAASVSVVIASDQSDVPENLTTVGGSPIALGQTTKSASLPVTLASDDTVSFSPSSSSTASNPVQTTVGTSAGQIIAANANRKALAIQNTGTTRIYLVLESGTPTATAYHIALPACGTANDGSSPLWDGTISNILWLGAIQALSSAAGGTCVLTELT